MFQIKAKFARSTTADAGRGRLVVFDADGVAETDDPWAAGHFAAMPPSLGYSVEPHPGPTFTQDEAPEVLPTPADATRSARRETLWGDADRIRRDEEEHSDGPPRFLPALMAERILDRYTTTEVAEIASVLLPKRPGLVVDFLEARHTPEDLAVIAAMLVPRPPEPLVDAAPEPERTEAAPVKPAVEPQVIPTIDKTAKGQKERR